ncbi:hypothetical protein PIROE2DRAFT_6916 [Piromyces sp. E2]|nr:hypothetical protein PIROE2DRAFT_6916 [Piromyces sp. E2]|eukprot:OUM66021.1 hypothetical protein PIROE2DRAFT_6916 [Piromyces sp. E2]
MIFSNNFVFAKYWYTPSFIESSENLISILPGVKPDVSGSVLGGNSIVINKYIDDERKEAAINALKIFTSKEMQKKITMEFNLYSGIFDLYDDEAVCEKVDCDLFKSVQFINRPSYNVENYEKYSDNYRDKVYRYLYGNAKVEDVLQQIVDITKIYYISCNTKESIVGVIAVIVVASIAIIIIISSSFLFMGRYKFYYQFLSRPLWFINLGGSILVLMTTIFEIIKALTDTYTKPDSKKEAYLLLLSHQNISIE